MKSYKIAFICGVTLSSLISCTNSNISSDFQYLRREPDVKLARQMGATCYDWDTAWARTQSQYMSFERTIGEVSPIYNHMFELAGLMAPRANIRLQRIREHTLNFFAFNDLKDLREACRLAYTYTPGSSEWPQARAAEVNSTGEWNR